MAASESTQEVFSWLKTLALAPEYHPTVAEFQDPISYIFKIEKEASKYGICKIVPPVSSAPKKTAIANLNRSLAARAGGNEGLKGNCMPTFTTRQQQIGFCPRKPLPVKRPVWQSGENYTFQQFEAKAKSFEKNYLKKYGKKGGFSGLEMETLFWKASVDKPFSVEYANDMPGSAFAAPSAKKGRREAGDGMTVGETAWNMRGVSRSKGSLLRFMKEEIPGVTSPMVYVAMMFSWFAWHVEDHDLHSLNYMHMGAGKTWYGVPREAAVAFEEVVRIHGYGGEINPLVTFAVLGEKTTVMSPEVFISAGIPCCRLVQNAGEFVVTFPRAYHSGFSHGFNCGEAANIATPEWLTVAKDAAIRRASINYPPMVSHIQLLYDLALSLSSRVSMGINAEPRSSRLKDKRKGEGETMVKELFVQNVMQNNDHLHSLGKGCSIVILPQSSSDISVCSNYRVGSQLRTNPSFPLAFCNRKEAISNPASLVSDDIMIDGNQAIKKLKGLYSMKEKISSFCGRNMHLSLTANNETSTRTSQTQSAGTERETTVQNDRLSDQRLFSCVTCGILTFSCVAIIQPKEPAARYLMSADCSFFNDWIIGSGITSDGFNVAGEDRNTSEHNYATGWVAKSVPDGLYDVPVQSGDYQIHRENQSNGVISKSDGQRDSSALGLLAMNYGNSSDSEEDQIEPDASLSADKTNMINSLSEDKYQSDNSGMHSLMTNGGSANEGQNVSLSNLRLDSDNAGPLQTFDCSVEFDLDGRIKNPREVSGTTSNIPWVAHDVERPKFSKAIVPPEDTDMAVVPRSDEDSSRLHIFCLEHAVEVEQQLRPVGGVHMLLLCHPDYPKVEAEAKLLAEELKINFLWNDTTFRDTTKADEERIQSALCCEEATPGNGDWAVKLGINLYYSANLSRSPIYSKQMPYNSVIYNAFGRSATATSPKKSNVYVRRSGKQKKVVAGKWCGKVWMSNQVHPFLAQKHLEDEDQDQDRSVHAFELPDEKPERDSENIPKTERMPMMRKSARKRKMTADSGSLKKVKYNDRDDVVLDVKMENNSQQCRGTSGRKQTKWIETEDAISEDFLEDSSHLQQRTVRGKQAKYIEREFGVSDDTSENNSHLQHKRSLKGKQAMCLEREYGVSDDSEEDSSHQRREMTLQEKLARFIEREDELSDDLQEDDYYRQPRWSLSGKKAKFFVRENEVSDDSLEENILGKRTWNGEQSKCIEREDEVSDDSGYQNRDFRRTQDNIFEPEDGVSDDSLETNARQILGGKQSKCFKKVVSLSEDSQDDDAHWQHTKLRGKQAKSIEQEDAVSDNSLDDTPQYRTLRGKGDVSGNNSSQQHRRILRSKQMKQETPVLRKQQTQRQMKKATPDLRNEEELEGGPSTRLRIRPSKAPKVLETKVKETLQPKSKRKLKNAATVKASAVYNKVEPKDEEDGYHCDIEGCAMSFSLKQELILHKRNICPVKGCGKKFFSHKYLVQHRRVHLDDRPLKCPWRGCKMSFKWAWARTEHIRVHTGVRPYTCAEPGCGQTFRFVSDFSRHKRKTGHVAKKSRG